jgi:serine/threonine-protein kinase HipA
MAVAEVVASVRDKWPTLPERDVVPSTVLERIDAHFDAMAVVLDPGSGH